MYDNGIHKGHRERLKERFLCEGLDHFEEHNILELLLFFGIPYKDTNEIAHELLNQFGSFSGVFDADINSLCKVRGMTKNASVLLKLIPPLSRRYVLGTTARPSSERYDGEAVKLYLKNLFLGEKKECIYVVLFDKSFNILRSVRITDDRTSEVRMNMRYLIENAFACSAYGCAIAHNHPGGTEKSSLDDIYSMNKIKYVLSELDITLYGNYIVTKDKVVENRVLELLP